ncbi:hypothetical protein K456DRAFT_381529 [Colletotrichum gloeosporioides 23]|nr:hypothetical protein K456DRAFT_381529 [Colletotrichum gloeosporioides 23]
MRCTLWLLPRRRSNHPSVIASSSLPSLGAYPTLEVPSSLPHPSLWRQVHLFSPPPLHSTPVLLLPALGRSSFLCPPHPAAAPGLGALTGRPATRLLITNLAGSPHFAPPPAEASRSEAPLSATALELHPRPLPAQRTKQAPAAPPAAPADNTSRCVSQQLSVALQSQSQTQTSRQRQT